MLLMVFLVPAATEANCVILFCSFLLDEHIAGDHVDFLVESIGLSIAAKLCPTARMLPCA